MTNVSVPGYCPACGTASLYASSNTGLVCLNPACTQPDAAAQILQDSEIHHIVRFQEYDFNVQHPLRERIGGSLLDCSIHDVVIDHLDNHPSDDYKGTTWRITAIPAIPSPNGGYHPQEADWEWEKL